MKKSFGKYESLSKTVTEKSRVCLIHDTTSEYKNKSMHRRQQTDRSGEESFDGVCVCEINFDILSVIVALRRNEIVRS